MGIRVSDQSPAVTVRECESGSPRLGLAAGELAPLLAGAQARGMADLLDMLGHGAILLDRSGKVLFASDRARQMMAGVIAISAGHLAGVDPGARARLDMLLAAAMAGEPVAELVFSVQDNEFERFSVQSLPAPAGPAACLPLLTAVLVVRKA